MSPQKSDTAASTAASVLSGANDVERFFGEALAAQVATHLSPAQISEALLNYERSQATIATLVRALELAEGRVALLMNASHPESDHPVATEYVLKAIRAALAGAK